MSEHMRVWRCAPSCLYLLCQLLGLSSLSTYAIREAPSSISPALPVPGVQPTSPAKELIGSELYTRTPNPAGSRGAAWVERVLGCG